ncbi:MAG: 16S rRNA (uracil(1498)-N(3))-methyltransferase [Clostridia bacterium]|nr:16S rRNA (uracil(1498)-N(3))-methyltransferase [Clostridia bacterium]
MELRRFYIEKSMLNGSHVTINGEEYHHMVKVLRYKNGYSFIACDGSGKDYYCKIINISADEVLAEITDIADNNTEAIIDITLYLGAIKNEKLTIAIQKAIELGVKNIVIFESAHTSEKGINFDRLNKIAVEAAKQCGRAQAPTIGELISFEKVIERRDGELLIMAYEKENSQTLPQLVKLLGKITRLGIIIGSEGGFKKEEADMAQAKGISTFSLGRRILRAETAAIIAAGYIIQELDIL